MSEILQQINSIGKAFVEFAGPMLIQSSVLVLIFLLADLLLRKKVRAVFRYWMWMLVLVKLVLPTSLSLPMSFGYWFGDKLGFIQRDHLDSRSSIPDSGFPFEHRLVGTERALSTEPAPVPGPEPAIGGAEPVNPPTVSMTPLSWQGALFLVWVAVVIMMSLLLLQRAIFVRGLIAQAEESPGSLKDTLQYCCEQMAVKRKVGLKISPSASSPAVCGLFRPVILMPQKLASSLGSDRLRVVLMHELAHIKRADLWVSLAQTFLQIIYFYNPLLWLANAIIRRVREQAVDEMVLVAMGDAAQQYPQTLLDVAKLAFRQPALSLRLIGVVESKSALASRIKHILNRPIPKTAKLGILGLITISIIAAVLLPMAKGNRADNGDSDNRVQKENKFIAILPNGVTVELIGLCEHPSEAKRWWGLDGQPIAIPYERLNYTESSQDYKRYEVAYRVFGSDDIAFTIYSNDAVVGYAGPYPLNEKAKGLNTRNADNAYGAIILVKPDAQSIVLEIGAGREPDWKTLCTQGSPVDRTSTSGPGVVFQPAIEKEGKTYLTIAHQIKDKQIRVVAVDNSGQLHKPEGVSNTTSNRLGSCRARFNLPAQKIKEIRFQTQKFQRVTFINVSLKPGVKTDVQVQVVDAFGEVVERVIYSSEISKDFFFDLDRNEAFTPPSYLTRSSPPEEVIEWSLKHGIDFLNDKGRFEITPQTIFVKVANNLWYGSAEDVLDTLKTGFPEEVIPDYETVPPGLQFSQSRGDEPKTYVFETRDGGIGLLQLFESKNGNVKIRYKMLKQRSAKNLAILTDKPPVVLDLDRGKVMRLDKDWPDEYDVSWDNDAGGSLFTKPDGLVSMLPILEAENFADALSIAAQKIESLKQRGIHGVPAERSRYILIKTSQGKVALVEVEEFDESKAKIRWQIIQQAIEKTAVQVEPAVSKWEDIGRAIPPDFNDTTTLAEHITLTGIGQDAEGKTFVTCIRDATKTENRVCRFLLVKKDDSILEPSDYGTFGPKEKLQEKFSFDTPFLAWQIKEFRFQSRFLHAAEGGIFMTPGVGNFGIQSSEFKILDLAPPGRHALSFDGVDDYLLVPSSPNLTFEPPFTIELWIKPEFPKEQLNRWPSWGLLAQGCYTGTGKVKTKGFGIKLERFRDDPASLHINYCTANERGIYATTYSTDRFDDWIHISHVFRNDNYEPAYGHPLVVGKFLIPSENAFKGQIGEIRIWNCARSHQEIERYKNVALTGKEPGLAACWTFEQSDERFAYDISANGNHARPGSAPGPDEADPEWIDLQASSHRIVQTDATASAEKR